MTLAEMRSLLATHGIRLTRSLGQNFLHDQNQVRRIVELAGLQPGGQVLEIGPGLGPLTEALLAAGARVVAIEKDARVGQILESRLGHESRLQILIQDALHWLKDDSRDLSDWQVVSNLPYSVGSTLLVDLAELSRPPESLTVTLQAEVVDRIRAQPGSAEYGILTLLLARVYEAGRHFQISPTCFFPVPDVTSGCIRLERRSHPLVAGHGVEAYHQLVKTGFSQRRKRFLKLLRKDWPEGLLGEVWKDLELHPDVRAEALSPETFASLSDRLGTKRSAKTQ